MRKLAAVLGMVVFAVSAAAENGTWSKRFPNAQEIEGIALASGGYWVKFATRSGECVAFVDAAGSGRSQQCFNTAPPMITAAKGAHFLYGFRFIGTDPPLNVMKFDDDNRLLWSRRVTVPDEMIINGGDATKDGGIVLAGGYGEASCGTDCSAMRASCVVKLAADGTLQWFRILDESGLDAAWSIRQAGDGYVLAATAENRGIRVSLLDATGAPTSHLWLPDAYGKPSLGLLPGGDIVVGATRLVAGRAGGYVIARISSSDKLVWQKSALTNAGDMQSVLVRRDGSFVVYGRAFVRNQWGAYLIVFDGNGSVIWQRQIVFPTGTMGEGIQIGVDGSVLLAMSGRQGAEIHRFSDSGDVPPAISAITTVSNLAFAPLSSIQVKTTVEVAGVDANAVNDPLPSRVETIVTQDATPARADSPEPQIAATRPKQRSALAPALRAKDEEDQLTKQVVHLLSQRRFAELEKIGADFRDTRARFIDATAKLATFYTAVSTPALEYGDEQQHQALVDAWLAAYPTSATAATAAASTYIGYAWSARSGSMADAVTGAGWKSFETLLGRAHQILVAARPYAGNDPQYWMARSQVAGASCDGVSEIAHDPQFAHLTDWSMWRNTALFMLPRWCGSPDEYRRFAEYAAASTRSEFGDGLYGLSAYDAVKAEGNRSIIAAYKFEWPRIRRGLYDIIKRYPDAPFSYHRLAFMAWFFDDRATAKAMFDKPIVTWNSFAKEIWPTELQFDQAKEWAAAQPQPSFVKTTKRNQSTSASALRKPPDISTSWVASGAANWPPLLMLNDIQLADGTAAHSYAFLVQSKSGVVAVSALANFGTEVVRRPNANAPMSRSLAPIAFDAFRAKLASWTMASAAKPAQKFTVARINPAANGGSHGVVLTLNPAKGALPVKVLAPRADNGPASGRLYLVACRPNSKPCVQAAFVGTIFVSGAKVSVILDEDVDWRDLVGAPAIDEEGHVVGVAAGPSTTWENMENAEAVRIDVEEINALLARAGV